MRVLLLKNSYQYFGKCLKSASNPIKRAEKVCNVGDYLSGASVNKSVNIENYECKGLAEYIRQLSRYKKAFGVNWWDIFRGNILHQADAIPSGIFNSPILSAKRIASVKLKSRSGKVIDANIDKLDFGIIGKEQEYYYVLKNKNKQIGYINVLLNPQNEVSVEYITNILGRKKYRRTEQILIQSVVEDCLSKGFIPDLNAYALNIGQLMGRRQNNLALYKKMGMHSDKPTQPKHVSISREEIIPLLEKYQKHNGEIIEGSKERLYSLINQ